MLFEKINYEDDFPLNITIASIDEYPIHYHQDTEFVVVIKGEILLKNGYCKYTLKEGDVFTNAGHEVHSLASTGEDNIVAIVQVSTHYFSQYFPSITKACYRTYTNKGHTEKHDTLRERLLQILLHYLMKGFNYKSECSYMMVDVIKFMEKHFNLFAFEDDVVVNFESGNQIAIDRISRIINYIYQHHSSQITLDDLAAMEHLSTFYLSHIIKNHTGMNFREFLCFARVEWSEISLLETDHKISRVARDVGFSATSYYVKYFKKWFGMDPQTYREQSLPHVLSDERPARITPQNPGEMIATIKQTLTTLSAQRSSDSFVNTIKIDLKVDAEAPEISAIEHHIDLHVTLEDFNVLGYSMFSLIEDMGPERVTILTAASDKLAEINRMKVLLTSAGYEVVIGEDIDVRQVRSYGYDSIAYPIFVLNHLLKSKGNWIRVRLRDPGEATPIIKGYPAVLTSSGIKKPVFYAYETMSALRGDIIYWGKNYCVSRMMRKGKPVLLLLVYNFNETINDLCIKDASKHLVKDTLNDYKDEIDMSVSVNIQQGLYNIYRYSMPRTFGIFANLAALNFPDSVPLIDDHPRSVAIRPYLDVYTEDVRTTFDINFAMQGADIQLAIISPK